MSVNAPTVNSITDNLIAILEGLSGFTFEKDKVDQKIHTWVQLNIAADREEESHGQGPMYLEQDYEIVAVKEIDDKTDLRITATQVKWTIKEAITVAALNTGDLASPDNLVILVELTSTVDDYSSSGKLLVTINLTVKFRDLRI